MKASLHHKLLTIADRYGELTALLSDNATIANPNCFRELSVEYAQLEPIVLCFSNYQAILETLSETQQLLEDSDLEIREMAQTELPIADKKRESLEQELQLLLLPKDPDDNRNTFLEIRAAAGGDESAIFSGDLFRMYSRYAEKRGWSVEVLSSSQGEHGGYKEIIARIVGTNVYSQLKFESGAHRVQRVPETEAQGRVHTSTCTVAIMPEVDEVAEIDINPADLRVDTYRASGAGGQHVNRTDSAIRITHLPSGIVVECQDERSQHKNRARAMSVLKARLMNAEREKQQSEQTETRRRLVGTGDRSERIRTYNYPQSRMTDHRINLTLYCLEDIMEGNLDVVIDPLIREYQADQLAQLGV